MNDYGGSMTYGACLLLVHTGQPVAWLVWRWRRIWGLGVLSAVEPKTRKMLWSRTTPFALHRTTAVHAWSGADVR